MIINFIGKRRIALFVSGAFFLASAVVLLLFGLRANIDFSGGSLLEISFTAERPAAAAVQETLKDLNLGEIVVQPTGASEIILKLKFLTEYEHQFVLDRLRERFEREENKVLENRFETIGPAISSQLRERSGYAGVAVLIGIVVYIAYSFRRVSKPVASWKYGVTAIIALLHDVAITAGVFAILGKIAGIEVGIPFVVALLTILGYSVNDTIVVFDRIRENLIRRSSENFPETVNIAVNETLARSLNTTLTTMLVLAALFFFGGESIKYFSLALLIGIFLGAYSSIFVASPLLVEWHNWKRRNI